ETGWLVPSDDPVALAGALREALGLVGEERARWAARAMDHVRQNYSKQLMCARTIAVYHELLEDRVRMA
ncbi:MAG: glycosyl transferase, partial [Alphaproteobacteria bacterium]|nr:glycosyl transferase [Alphaproteobacteria bacterium]